MARSDAFCESGDFYCYPLGAATVADERDIMSFRPVDPKGAGLVTNYRRYGFKRLSERREEFVHARLKPRYDAQCVFMYMVV